MISLLRCWLCVVVLAASGAAAADPAASGMSRQQAYTRAAALAAVGEKLFFDASLSASGKLACAGCHSPDHAFGPSDARAVTFGGKDMRQPGLRAAPSLAYLQAIPHFAEHYYESEDEGDNSVDNGPTGGLTWDGRVDRGRDQARVPLFSPFEMANDNAAALAARVRQAPYADELSRIFGEHLFEDDDKAVAAIAEALEVFEQDHRFHAYSSKYDAYLAATATLTPQEARGLALFNDPAKGNCNSCHRSQRGKDGTPPQFTDHGLIAIGVPRNHEIPSNADPAFFDLGMCGPLRTDLAGHRDYCGRFRTPSLRNVALRARFFHNGVVRSLHEAVAFYAERDADPAKWYPRDADGAIRKYDDLPPQYHGNINNEPPFGDRPAGAPALTAAEIDDIVAFLATLTDGYLTRR